MRHHAEGDLLRRRRVSFDGAAETPEDEVGLKHTRPHSVRHTFCSFCPNNKVPKRTVLWLRHADSDMIRRYSHLSDEKAKRHLSRLSLRRAAESA